jgi:hypothetical protein
VIAAVSSLLIGVTILFMAIASAISSRTSQNA